MKILIATILMSLSCTLIGQNLVPNPSFEEHSGCPEFPPTADTPEQISLADGWYRPTQGTSDYLHVCGSGQASVPEGFYGYQEPRIATDSAFVGIHTFYTIEVPIREYISVRIPELEVGKEYNVSMDISVGELSSVRADCMEVHFKTEDWSYNSDAIELIHDAQIDYSSNGIFENSETWMTVTDSFVADSTYTEMTIGCFTDPTEVNYFNFGEGNHLSAYFLVDNVCLTKPSSGCSGAVGIEESFADDLTVYPNPSNGSFQINQSGDIQVFNTTGSLVMSRSVFAQETIDLGDVESGMYFLIFESDQVTTSKKLIIK